MTKKYTELHTLVEIDKAIMRDEVVEFLAKTGQWVRVEKHNGQAIRRYRLVEEDKAAEYGPIFFGKSELELPIKDGDSLTAKTLRYKGANIFTWQRRAEDYKKIKNDLQAALWRSLDKIGTKNKLLKKQRKSIKERDELIRLLSVSKAAATTNIRAAATKKQPVFGDEIVVWDEIKPGKTYAKSCIRKFVYFNSKGHPMVLNSNKVYYTNWCWPEEVKDD